jgi:hypothetical protein
MSAFGEEQTGEDGVQPHTRVGAEIRRRRKNRPLQSLCGGLSELFQTFCPKSSHFMDCVDTVVGPPERLIVRLVLRGADASD